MFKLISRVKPSSFGNHQTVLRLSTDRNTKLNDLFKLTSYCSKDIYFRLGDDTQHYKVLNTDRSYKIERHVYHPPQAKELSCLYTAEHGDQKYAFITWKGTMSLQQALVDLSAVFQTGKQWSLFLEQVVDDFLPNLTPYMAMKGLDAADYEWYTTGHSLGGALAATTAAKLRANPILLDHVPIQNVITFASMKLPHPICENDQNFALDKKNGVIEFWATGDRLPEVFAPKDSLHIGEHRYDIGWDRSGRRGVIPHDYRNFQKFFEQHNVTLPGEIEPK
jgi:hypothetical protein